MSTTIPTSAVIRRDIHARMVELRALRRLLRLAEAAEAAAVARQARDHAEIHAASREETPRCPHD